MNAIAIRSWLLMFLVLGLARAEAEDLNVGQGIPADAYLAVYGRHNPERDFLRKYGEQVWQTVQREKLPERVLALVMAQVPGEQQETLTSISNELREIFAPVDWQAVADSPEVAYGQVMEIPQTHHLLLLRLPSEDVAVACESALKKLDQMIERRTKQAVVATADESGAVGIYTLSVPKAKEIPFQPAFARVKDVLVISTSEGVLRESVGLLTSGGQSKFDDPRLHAALEKLPKPDDGLIFYDGRQQFQGLRRIGEFIRQQAHGKPEADRWAGVFERVVDQLAILDYEVTVEYTEGHRLVKSSLGQLVPDAKDKVLYRACATGEPFEDWQRWVPADAQSYSLNTGVNLHTLDEWIEKFVRAELPEAQGGLEKFERAQQDWGVHLDADVLQAFSGEYVCLTLPASSPAVIGGRDKVVALRCHQPERIRELIQRGIEHLAQQPFVQGQQLKLVPSQELAGFDELSVNFWSGFGIRPVIGFHEGWMIVASNAAAAQKVLRTLAGEAPSIDKTEQFTRFGLTVDGPVYALGYTNLAGNTQQAAQFIRQAGAFAPVIVGLAGANQSPEKLKPLQEALALLPSIANVVDKFDFLDARLCVVQKGDGYSYTKRCVTLVRPPVATAEKKPIETTPKRRSGVTEGSGFDMIAVGVGRHETRSESCRNQNQDQLRRLPRRPRPKN